MNSYGEYLLKTNLKFFRGEIDETYYNESDQISGNKVNDNKVNTDNLIKLTEKYRIFTTDGKTSYSDKIISQRSYLISYMEQETFKKIYQKLLNDTRIWNVFIFKKNEEKNFIELSSLDKNKKRIVLRMDYGEPYVEWIRNIKAREEYESCYENIKNIIKDMVYCLIVCKEWNKELNNMITADTILLEHMEKV